MGRYKIPYIQSDTPGKVVIPIPSEEMHKFSKSTALSVMAILAIDADSKGFVEISIAELSQLIGFGAPAIQRGLDLLEHEGYLEIVSSEYVRPSRFINEIDRWRIYKRDKYCCRYCGKTDGPFSIDHIIPLEHGGGSAPENLVTACPDCNSRKSNRTPEEANMILQPIEDQNEY